MTSVYPREGKYVASWLLGGGIVILMIGSFWHFIYDVFNHASIIALIAPINESVWEHLKMGYWPVVFYSIFEYRALKRKVNNYLPGKLISVIVLNISIVIIFYSYTYFTGKSILWIDIGSFITGIIAGQLALKYFMHLPPFSQKVQILSGFGFIAIGFLFAIFSYYPPHWPIFMDHVTHGYGIPH